MSSCKVSRQLQRVITLSNKNVSCFTICITDVYSDCKDLTACRLRSISEGALKLLGWLNELVVRRCLVLVGLDRVDCIVEGGLVLGCLLNLGMRLLKTIRGVLRRIIIASLSLGLLRFLSGLGCT